MDEMRTVSLVLPQSTLDALDTRAKREDRSRSAVVRRVIDAALAEEARIRGAEARRQREMASHNGMREAA